MSATVARPSPSQSAHWYHADGRPCHTVIAKGTGQPRPTTLRDARELGLLPSVTTILKGLHKPELQNWLIEQACLAVLTTPKRPDESLDRFVYRVLHEEKQQDQERDAAADLGSRIHQFLADVLRGSFTPESDLIQYIGPVLDHLKPQIIRHCEYCVVGKGYAGTVDLITGDSMVDVTDFKTTRRLPEKSWSDHKLQLSAYAEALECNGFLVRSTWNIYISTTEPGKFMVCENRNWSETFDAGFEPVLRYWQWENNFGKP